MIVKYTTADSAHWAIWAYRKIQCEVFRIEKWRDGTWKITFKQKPRYLWDISNN